jgi:hypothetical protein
LIAVVAVTLLLTGIAALATARPARPVKVKARPRAKD